MLEHGGRLQQAAQHYGIPLEQWLDLSTGINPQGWPVPALSASCWQRLPEEDDGLPEAAQHYYGCNTLLPVAGSQAAIQALPHCFSPCRVGVLSPAYAEHAAAWQRAGHRLLPLAAEEIARHLDTLDVLLLLNPNNPDGTRFSPSQLQAWQQQLARRGGTLLIDEAFIDATPQQSMAPACGERGLIVLRSLGKFFGLAGARVGFVLAWPELLQALREQLGPWPISGPARKVARLALRDHPWQQHGRATLPAASQRLYTLLQQYGLPPSGGTALFQYCRTTQAEAWQQQLARQGIWVRRFDEPAALRFGLPGNETAWQRLEQALNRGAEV